MNVQTEHLDNHTARLIVELEPERFEKAKKDAARELSKKVNIHGFRKGKVPYNILVNYVGEAAIIEDAIENIGNDVYREALDASELDPYGPGNLEDVKLDPPTFIFTVPLQPTVELGDYRDIRLEYEAPTVEEDDIEGVLNRLQQQLAEAEDTEDPAQNGDRIIADIHSTFADDEPEGKEDESPAKGDAFIHEHGAMIMLNEEDDPILPGFTAAMLGVTAGETREFDLEIPEGKEGFEEIAGRKVHFEVAVQKVQHVQLPEIDDDFAARVSEDEEDGPYNLEQLREKIRKDLEEIAERDAKAAYAQKVLDAIVEQATIRYPEMAVEDRIEEMIRDLESRLSQQGLTLEKYFELTGQTQEELREAYRETAERSVERTLVLREIVSREGIEATEDQIQAHIDVMVAQFGDQAHQFRMFFDTPNMRGNIVNQLLTEHVMDFIAAIGMGEDPEAVLQKKADEAVEKTKAREAEAAAREAALAAEAEAAEAEADEESAEPAEDTADNEEAARSEAADTTDEAGEAEPAEAEDADSAQ